MSVHCTNHTCITYYYINAAFANPLYLNPDEMDSFDQSGAQPPDDDGTF